MNRGIDIIIMAGGEGKRMQSDLPKVLVKLGEYPMIIHILRQLNILSNSINIFNVYIVVGKHKEIITETIDSYFGLLSIFAWKIRYVNQDEPKGTGHAIKCCKNQLANFPYHYSIILSGDVPLISYNTILKYYWFCINKNSDASLIATNVEDPKGYGRIVECDNRFIKIVEEKDCNGSEKYITKINTGLYCIRNNAIINYIDKIDCNNSQNEYYLTDIFGLLIKDRIEVDVYNLEPKYIDEVTGVNTLEQLNELERKIKLH